MNGEIKASNALPGSSVYPSGVLGAGNLASIISERGNASRFSIFRADRISGRVSNKFTPSDVPDLANLAKLLSEVFHEDDQLDVGLRDDLGCLAHCLEEVFPRREELERIPELVARSFFCLINALIADEERHFAMNPSENHVYRHLLLIDAWFRGVSACNCQLEDFATFINPPPGFGLCPICGQNEGALFEERTYWFFCNAHQLRWLAGELISADFCGIRCDEELRERLHNYREVSPYMTLPATDVS